MATVLNDHNLPQTRAEYFAALDSLLAGIDETWKRMDSHREQSDQVRQDSAKLSEDIQATQSRINTILKRMGIQ